MDLTDNFARLAEIYVIKPADISGTGHEKYQTDHRKSTHVQLAIKVITDQINKDRDSGEDESNEYKDLTDV